MQRNLEQKYRTFLGTIRYLCQRGGGWQRYGGGPSKSFHTNGGGGLKNPLKKGVSALFMSRLITVTTLLESIRTSVSHDYDIG